MNIEKWKTKFKAFFDKEKVLDFDATPGSHIFSKKGIITNLEPKPIKPLGNYILKESSSFWVLFCNYNKNKIDGDIDMKERVRRQIVDNFFEATDKLNQQIQLKKWLDNLLYLPDIQNKQVVKESVDGNSSATPYSKFFQSAIKSNLKEIQQEEEIIFWEPVKKFQALNYKNQDDDQESQQFDVTFNQVGIKQIGENDSL